MAVAMAPVPTKPTLILCCQNRSGASLVPPERRCSPDRLHRFSRPEGSAGTHAVRISEAVRPPRRLPQFLHNLLSQNSRLAMEGVSFSGALIVTLLSYVYADYATTCVSDFYDSGCSRLLPGNNARIELPVGSCDRHGAGSTWRKVSCVNMANSTLGQLSIEFYSNPTCTTSTNVGSSSVSSLALTGCSQPGGEFFCPTRLRLVSLSTLNLLNPNSCPQPMVPKS